LDAQFWHVVQGLVLAEAVRVEFVWLQVWSLRRIGVLVSAIALI
jgi:hypothetical protein